MIISENKMDYKVMYENSLKEIKTLKENLQMNKIFIEEMIVAEKETEQKHQDEVLILSKLLAQNKYDNNNEK